MTDPVAASPAAAVGNYQPASPAAHAPVAGLNDLGAGIRPGLPIVEAELGTHSATNFYRGLSGNDIFEHGGLFVATYNVPNVGDTIKVLVSMPGGYEFEAVGVVRWTRDIRESTPDSSHPGCGIRITHISPEAQKLVYRYVRNREPLFYDDL